MAEIAAAPGGLLCVWLIDEEFLDRDELIAEAYAQLEAAVAEAGMRVVGPSTWRFFEAEALDGWRWWPGQLLIATVPAEPVAAAGAILTSPSEPLPAAVLTSRTGRTEVTA